MTRSTAPAAPRGPFPATVLPRTLFALAAAAALAAGCATVPAAGGAAAEANAAPPPVGAASSPGAASQPGLPASTPGLPASAPTHASAPAPGTALGAPPGGLPGVTPPLPAFALVTQNARRLDGLVPIWAKEDRVWLELRPEDFGKPLFLSPKVSQGLGEPGFYGGSMTSRGAPWGAPHIVEFRRIHNLVQLIAPNVEVTAAAHTPTGRAVANGYSPSLLAAAPVLTGPGPNGAVLVDANAIFLSDLLGMGLQLQRTYHQNYGLDVRNSTFTHLRNSADEVDFDVSDHFATATISTPNPGGAPGSPQPTVPEFLPDARSLFLGLHYALSRLPADPMHPRAADPRVGYFVTTQADFTDDTARHPRQRFVSRWRLEKKDPAAALSEPVKPITYWLDRTIPVKYRESITRGVLEWNKAFEKIGFKDALVVKVQPDDANFDTLDTGAASIRWMVNLAPSFGAIGPHHVDPRTGEILDADIAIESLSSRNQRAQRAQILESAAAPDFDALLQLPGDGTAAPAGSPMALARGSAGGGASALARDPEACIAGDYEAEQMDYALDVLQARGEIDPDSPEADAWVQAYLYDVTMHEVGHTLGLRHNFRASTLYDDKQLSDPAFTKSHALTGSVMDYAPVNLPRPGEPAPAPFQVTLGPYDYWAIEYAYKPLPPGLTAQQESAELKAIAARNAEPGLQYGTDEDNYLGLDPDALQFDLGADPIAFAAKRYAIARDLFAHQESRPLKTTDDYTVLRRSVSYAVRDTARATGVLVRQLGGVRTLRDFPGTGRDPLQPVPTATQRAALALLTTQLLSADAFQVSPQLQRRLAPDFLERSDASAGGESVATDFPVDTIILDLQRAVLGALMSDMLAQRLLDAAPKLDRPSEALAPGEVYADVIHALWTEPGTGDIPVRRRELQRDHVNRLTALLLRTPSGVRVDMRAELRRQATALLPRIQALEKRKGLSEAARAHLVDCAETLRLALSAPMQRAGY